MTVPLFARAGTEQLRLILAQVERQLIIQTGQAQAAGQRASLLAGIAAALAAIGAGLFAHSAASGRLSELGVAGAVALVGFSLTAYFAAEALRAVGLDADAFAPSRSFSEVGVGEGLEQSLAKLAERLEMRLDSGLDQLHRHEVLLDRALAWAVATPPVTAGTALAFALISG